MSTPDVISPAPVPSSSSTRAALPSVTPRSRHHHQKFGSNSRRHTIAQPPSGSSRDSTVFTPQSQSGIIASLFPIVITPNHNINRLTHHKSGASVSSIIIGQKLPQFFDRHAPASAVTAEREIREREQQSKEVIQMSIVNDQGTFVPPPPAEKGFLRDRFKDTDQDYFDTITRTSPERVKTFLSRTHRMSPGGDLMNPSAKIKRGAIPASFVRISTATTDAGTSAQPPQPQTTLPVQPAFAVRPLPSKVASIPVVKPLTPPKSTSPVSVAPTSSLSRAPPTSAEASLATPPSSPRTSAAVHTKDVTHTMPLPVPRPRTTIEQFPSRRNTLVHKEELSPLRTRTHAQMSFLTGDLDKPLSDDMEDALSDLIPPSSPSTVSGGDESLSSSWSDSTWSTTPSPKHSMFVASMKQAPVPAPMRRNSAEVVSKRDIRQMNAKKIRDMNFGAVGVAH